MKGDVSIRIRVLPSKRSPNYCLVATVENSSNGSMIEGGLRPYGSKDPNNRVLGPKYYNSNGIWALKPCYLGPWALREVDSKRCGDVQHWRDAMGSQE